MTKINRRRLERAQSLARAIANNFELMEAYPNASLIYREAIKDATLELQRLLQEIADHDELVEKEKVTVKGFLDGLEAGGTTNLGGVR